MSLTQFGLMVAAGTLAAYLGMLIARYLRMKAYRQANEFELDTLYALIELKARRTAEKAEAA